MFGGKKHFYLNSAGNFKIVFQMPQTSGIPTSSQEMKRWTAVPEK